MSGYSFHPELFEHRTLAMESLSKRGYDWFEHYSSIDLLHDLFGLEVCGIPDETDAKVILKILEKTFRDWPHNDLHYCENSREEG